MSNFHQALIDLRNDLGYEPCDKGVCALYAEKGIDAWLLGQAEYLIFKQRNDYIIAHTDIVKMLQDIHESIKLRTKLKRKETPPGQSLVIEISDEELTILEVAGYIEEGELYLRSKNYSACFGRKLSQENLIELSSYAQSIALEKLGGRAKLASFMGIYNSDEIIDYIRLLFRLADPIPYDFAMSICNDNHRINLCYNHLNKSWLLMDANQPTIEPIIADFKDVEKKAAKQLGGYLITAFQNQASTGFATSIFTTGQQRDQLQPYIDAFVADEEFKKFTDITKETAQRKTSRDVSLLWLAAQMNEIELLKKLIAIKDVNFNLQCNTAESPLFMAAQNGNIQAVELLLAAKTADGKPAVDLNLINHEGATPAFIAAQYGYADVMQLLTQAKTLDGKPAADLNKPYNHGATPAYLAAQNGFADVIQVLVDARSFDGKPAIDLNKPNAAGTTPFYIAAENGHLDVLRALLGAKTFDGEPAVDVNLAKRGGWTPAHIAAINGHVEVLKLMAENGAALNKVNGGKTPLQLALENRQQKASLFLQAWNKRNELLKQLDEIELTSKKDPAEILKRNIEILKIEITSAFRKDYELFLKTDRCEKEICKLFLNTKLLAGYGMLFTPGPAIPVDMIDTRLQPSFPVMVCG